ncbi:binding partner of ACD11 1-like [Diospyros lotus]|uniref:binding partner of ACD11 1-like n=1 Tax=Diospyros lotus TaxID=55363 RepID=UPI00225435C8|nr:binding partner of ACD11 1-like [Diospyros lotus]XP_052205108.1 binding partner of ACD11 1-like [Diospyros lotus]XP_052205109.1 binding partner of ACD11 1-like [Diospyros lotus]XP_052205110.1 binding partner of ACD11 1-like [Diospyros lotus]
MDLTDARNEPGTLPSSTPNWTINVSEVRTVRVSNISLSATEKDIKAFFSFSGEIQYVEMQRETETSQLAYVTFKDSQGADAAILQAGTTIGDLSVSITRVENYQLPPDASSSTFKEAKPTATSSAVKKTEDAVSTVLAKGFVLGKDALNKAKSFDERHHLMSNASATVASIDQKMGLTGKISIGTAVVNEKMREMNERFQVSEKTKSAFAAAEQKASTAGSAIMSNRYVLTGASWLSNAFSVVAKAAEDVSTMTKEKVGKAEEERKENLYKQRPATVNDFAQIHLDQSSVGELPVVAAHSADNNVSEHAII